VSDPELSTLSFRKGFKPSTPKPQPAVSKIAPAIAKAAVVVKSTPKQKLPATMKQVQAAARPAPSVAKPAGKTKTTAQAATIKAKANIQAAAAATRKRPLEDENELDVHEDDGEADGDELDEDVRSVIAKLFPTGRHADVLSRVDWHKLEGPRASSGLEQIEAEERRALRIARAEDAAEAAREAAHRAHKRKRR